MFRTPVLLIAAAVLAGCAAGASRQMPIALVDEGLVGKRIAVTTAKPPPFSTGAVDDNLAADYGIGDPAARIGRGLALRLVAERGMTLLLDDGAETEADYVIDVQTRAWSLTSFALTRDRYRLKYDARLQMIDRAAGRVLAEVACRSEQGDRDHPPGRDALIANGAALVKGYLDMATAACVDLVVRDALQLQEAVPGTLVATGAVSSSRPRALAPQAVPLPVSPAPPERMAVATDASAGRHAPADAEVRMAARTAPPDSVSVPPRAAQPTPVPTLAPLPRPDPAPQPTMRISPLPPSSPDPRQIEQDSLLRRDSLSDAARASGQVILLLEDTPFRDSPRRVSTVTRTLAAGKEVVVRQRIYNAEGEWWFIAIPGDIGWIPSPDPQIRR